MAFAGGGRYNLTSAEEVCEYFVLGSINTEILLFSFFFFLLSIMGIKTWILNLFPVLFFIAADFNVFLKI